MTRPFRLIAYVLFASGAVLGLLAALLFIGAGIGGGLDGTTRMFLTAALFIVAGFDFGIGWVFYRKSVSSIN